MAGVMGLEPTAFAVTGRRCNQLNYTPALGMLIEIALFVCHSDVNPKPAVLFQKLNRTGRE